MQISQIPVKMPTPFAANAAAGYSRQVPIPSQIGINPGFASFNDGFVPANFTSVNAGGIPPFGQDMNGLMNAATAWLRWAQAGAPIVWDSAFSTAIGGYPKGAVLASSIVPGMLWLSTADNNTNNPDSYGGTSGGGNWVPHPAQFKTGDPLWRPTSETFTGWVVANGTTTIGSASSGATFADPSAQFLYTWLWSQFSNAQCPVTGGRGANAAADWAANKPILVLDFRGAGVMGVDTMSGGATTRLSGVPASSGSATVPGSVLGENLHTLQISEITTHSHTAIVSDPGHLHSVGPLIAPGSGAVFNSGNLYGQLSINSSVATTGISVSNANNGGGGAHNTVHSNMLGFYHLKL